jgi:hypothetical protein
MRALLIVGTAFALAGCATAQSDEALLEDMFAPVPAERIRSVEADAAAAGIPLGSEKNPVRTSMPAGERAYLERLRCSDGNAPAFHRSGSVGEGPYGKIMDRYELTCLTGQPATASVYMDMYHDHVEDRPVPGFTIKPQ